MCIIIKNYRHCRECGMYCIYLGKDYEPCNRQRRFNKTCRRGVSYDTDRIYDALCADYGWECERGNYDWNDPASYDQYDNYDISNHQNHGART